MQIKKVENEWPMARRVIVRVADWTVRGTLRCSACPSECWKIAQIKKFDNVCSAALRVRIQIGGWTVRGNLVFSAGPSAWW